jgi:diguanylate cyclase (GGDEF)-like protein
MTTTTHTKLRESKHRFVKQVWVGAAILAVIDAPIIIWRGVDIGWHTQLILHFILFLSTIVVALARNKLSFNFMAIGLIIFSMTLGLSGIFSLGMTGTGFFWVAFSTFLVCMLYSHEASVVITVLAAASMVSAGICFMNGWIQPPFNLAEHVASPSGWLNFLAIAVAVPFITLVSVSRFQRTVIDLLDQVAEQRDLLLSQREIVDQQKLELEQLARKDHLTGLPSVRVAEDRLQMAALHAKRVGDKVAVMFIDLDGFKAVNDTYGHGVGDEVLKEVADRLSGVVRNTDTVARIGGDEFIAILGEAHDLKAIHEIGQAMIEIVRVPIGERNIKIGASIGVAIYPDDSGDINDLRDKADKAMYCAKRAGKNRLEFYNAFC